MQRQAPLDEARRDARLPRSELVPSWRNRARQLRRLRFDADRMRADRARVPDDGTGRTLLRRHPSALGGVQVWRGLRLETADACRDGNSR